MVVPPTLYLLDTNIVTYVVSGRSQQSRQNYRIAESQSRVAVSAITEGEIRYGFAHNPTALRARVHLEEFLRGSDCLPFDSAAAQAYGSLRANLAAAGLTLGSLDLLIAAHAMALNATLVTHDRALLRANRFLSVEDWATDI